MVVDAVKTAFARAGEKGIFWNTRADDLIVSLLKALIKQNPKITPGMIEDNKGNPLILTKTIILQHPNKKMVKYLRWNTLDS